MLLSIVAVTTLLAMVLLTVYLRHTSESVACPACGTTMDPVGPGGGVSSRLLDRWSEARRCSVCDRYGRVRLKRQRVTGTPVGDQGCEP